MIYNILWWIMFISYDPIRCIFLSQSAVKHSNLIIYYLFEHMHDNKSSDEHIKMEAKAKKLCLFVNNLLRKYWKKYLIERRNSLFHSLWIQTHIRITFSRFHLMYVHFCWYLFTLYHAIQIKLPVCVCEYSFLFKVVQLEEIHPGDGKTGARNSTYVCVW